MKIYFFTNPVAPPFIKNNSSAIAAILRSLGTIVIHNLDPQNYSNPELDRAAETGESMIEKIDGVVIEGSVPSFESGHLIALALTHKKPILYLVEKSKPVDDNLKQLQKNKDVKKYFEIEYYQKEILEEKLIQFLERAEIGEGREQPNIKFTLRITPRIERFLHWKTHNTNISKADYLRDLIEKLIDEDKEYKKRVDSDK